MPLLKKLLLKIKFTYSYINNRGAVSVTVIIGNRINNPNLDTV